MSNVIMPSVTKEQAKGFSKVWNKGGISIILDDTAIQFAADFANIALRSFVEDQMKKVAAIKDAKEKEVALPSTSPQKSNIIMTD